MSNRADGLNYALKGKAKPVVEPGAFYFAAAELEHGHINGMCNGLTEAGATLKWVWDPDPKKVEALLAKFPGAKAARCEQEIFDDPQIQLVAGAAVPAARAALGMRAMRAERTISPTKRRDQFGAAGRGEKDRRGDGQKIYVLFQRTAACGKRRLRWKSGRRRRNRPGFAGDRHGPAPAGRRTSDWFWRKADYGGILTDIASHQIEQYLFYSGATDAQVVYSQVANHHHPEHPEFEDFGDAMLQGNNGTTNYFRVDWFTPDGLDTWGDGRLFILGTDGYIELRKYTNVATQGTGNHLFLVITSR
jgi:predicted dehydrogenase